MAQKVATPQESLYRRLPMGLPPIDQIEDAKSLLASKLDSGEVVAIAETRTGDLLVLVDIPATPGAGNMPPLYGKHIFRRPLTPALSWDLIETIAGYIMSASGAEHFDMRLMTWPHLPRVLAMAVFLGPHRMKDDLPPVGGPTPDTSPMPPMATALSA